MNRKIPSPLSEVDMDRLEALAAKANAHTQDNCFAPLYMAIDVGDAHHQHGYLFLCWPALDPRSDLCARKIFDYIADMAMVAFGAEIFPITPGGRADAGGPTG